MFKPIILIGGAAGTGKTTLAKRLCNELEIDHRISTGFIRSILQTQLSKTQHPELFHDVTFRDKEVLSILRIQSELIKPGVIACIERSIRDGNSLIMEGNHLNPALYAGVNFDFHLVLTVTCAEKHLEMLKGPTHSLREISGSDLDNVRITNMRFKYDAECYQVPVFSENNSFEDIVGLLR